MKYFIFSQGYSKIYIAALSRESIISGIEHQISKNFTNKEKQFIKLGTESVPLSPFIKYLKRRPAQGVTCFGVQLDAAGDVLLRENGGYLYAVLDLKSFSLVEDDSLSGELFFPQVELYRSFLTKELDSVLIPEDWHAEVNLEKKDFMEQLITLVAHKLLCPVYKVQAPFLSEEENPWTENLSELKQEYRGPQGQVVNGRDLHQILVAFKRIA